MAEDTIDDVAPFGPVREESPTHRCKVCGALWKLWEPGEALPGDEGSWSLVFGKAGKCCDNVEMGDQIERLPTPCRHENVKLPESHDEKGRPAQYPVTVKCPDCGAPVEVRRG